MSKFLNFNLLFLLGFTPLSLAFLSGCNNKNTEPNQTLKAVEAIERIEGVAALGQLNPHGAVRKLAAPTSGMGGTPRLSKILVREGESIVKGQILAVFDNRPKLKTNLKSEQANLNTLTSEIKIKKREIIILLMFILKPVKISIVKY